MKSKSVVAIAVAGLFITAGASANQTDQSMSGHQYEYHMSMTDQQFPSSVSEAPAAMTTMQSLDTRTGGYKGWGPMANPQVASSVSESAPMEILDKARDEQQQLAEVRQAREQVWVANAPLRSEYENIGSTRSRAGGFGGFFSRDSK